MKMTADFTISQSKFWLRLINKIGWNWFTLVDKLFVMVTVFEKHPNVCKPEACGQTMLPVSQKLIEKAKIENFRCDILSDFQTLCMVL